MRMMLACGGVPVLLGLLLGRSLHFGVDIWSCHPTQEGNDGRPYGQWVSTHVIAEPYRTIIHWHPNTEFREDQSSCEALYQSVLQAMRFTPRSRPRRIRSAASGRV